MDYDGLSNWRMYRDLVWKGSIEMNTLEKAQEQFKTAKETFDYVQHAAIHDRKLTKDGHMNGHYVKALQELEKVKKHYEDLVHRAEAQA